MQPKNIQEFTKSNRAGIPVYFYKKRFLVSLVAALLLLIAGCKKSAPEFTENVFEQYFEENILNNDFIVKYATDSGNVVTPMYQGYIFRLMKNTYYDGPMTAIKNGVTYNGTWSSNEEYGKLVIQLTHPDPIEFKFLNRQWRFTRKAIPLMELAPWGTSDPKVLHMERQ